MPEPIQQLPLSIALRDDATLENFYFFDGQALLPDLLRRPVSENGERFIFLHGASGCGRSHILQAACQSLKPGASLYLPLADLIELPPLQLLDGVEDLQMICLDDVDAIVGHLEWEQALFHLFNRVLESDARLMFSGSQSPRHLGVRMADLRSRLSWGLVVQLPMADDSHKQAILQFRAKRRGLELSPEVAHYIMTRAGRSLNELLEILDQLDRASLVHQRQLSVPFVKTTLDW